MASNNVQTALHSATYNMILQMIFRLLTFLLNALVLRYISKDVLGIVNVRLTLLYSSLLFLSREAFRKACLTRDGNYQKKWQQTINLLWLCLPFGLFLSLILTFIWLNLLQLPPSELYFEYKISAYVFGFSACLELCAEPAWLIAQTNQFVKLKVVAEGAALGFKCLSTALLIIVYPKLGLYAFCIAQLTHAFIYVSVYNGYFLLMLSGNPKSDLQSLVFPLSTPKDLLPNISAKPLIGLNQLWLTISFLKQSFLKQFLTEGEKYIMTFFAVLNFAEQGVFDVINNLGSLAARFIFLPLEESFYVLFSQVLVRGEPQEKQTKEAIQKSALSLQGILKFVSLIGSIIFVFGQSYSYLLLDIYGGKILSANEGPKLLQWYCLYVFVIAINGITECFMFACMSQDDVDKYNYKMFGFSTIFLGCSLLFTKLFGSVGFIMANCLNMILRIIQSTLFIKKFFKTTEFNPLAAVFPSTLVFSALIGSLLVTSLSSYIFCCSSGWLYRIIHIFIGAICLLIVTLSIIISEKEFIEFIKIHFHKSKPKNQ